MSLPLQPQFYYIKVGYKGVFIARTCFPDAYEKHTKKYCESHVCAFSKRFRLTLQCLSFIGITYAVPKTALLIIDVQNCFLPGGSLAVPGGDKIIPIINDIRAKYGDKMAATVLSQVVDILRIRPNLTKTKKNKDVVRT